MSLKDDLLRIGYLPENLPPPFHTEAVAKYFSDNASGYLSDVKQPFRSAVYSFVQAGHFAAHLFSHSPPKQLMIWRSFCRPVRPNWTNYLKKNEASLSVPRHTPDGDRALEISSHNQLEMERLTRLSGCRFVAKTDISRFYQSIYTHSFPWAFHGKEAAKKIRKFDSDEIYFNRLGYTLRQARWSNDRNSRWA